MASLATGCVRIIIDGSHGTTFDVFLTKQGKAIPAAVKRAVLRSKRRWSDANALVRCIVQDVMAVGAIDGPEDVQGAFIGHSLGGYAANTLTVRVFAFDNISRAEISSGTAGSWSLAQFIKTTLEWQ